MPVQVKRLQSLTQTEKGVAWADDSDWWNIPIHKVNNAALAWFLFRSLVVQIWNWYEPEHEVFVFIRQPWTFATKVYRSEQNAHLIFTIIETYSWSWAPHDVKSDIWLHVYISEKVIKIRRRAMERHPTRMREQSNSVPKPLEAVAGCAPAPVCFSLPSWETESHKPDSRYGRYQFIMLKRLQPNDFDFNAGWARATHVFNQRSEWD